MGCLRGSRPFCWPADAAEDADAGLLPSSHQRWASGIPPNLPADCEVITSRVDAARDAVALIIRSASFPRIPKGAPLVEFVPEAVPPTDRASCDDRLMLLFVPARNLSPRLTSPRGGWMTNLPPCPTDGNRCHFFAEIE